jgi:putative two-component system hydrogenase maturation factor HypX/HoxX
MAHVTPALQPVVPATAGLRILFVVSAHNSLSQRALVALRGLGHDVTVAIVDSGAAVEAAVDRHRPELIVCPMLKTIIPERVWRRHRCLVVHPGPPGDRGPSSLDWAIELGMDEWGVTVLEASDVLDGGDVWAARTFPMRDGSKSHLYRHEVRRAAIDAVIEAVGAIAAGRHAGEPQLSGLARPPLRQAERAIDWETDSTETVVRRIRAADSHPGVLDTIAGLEFHLFGVHQEDQLRGAPGAILARRHGAICRATADGALWISQLKRPGHFKLPATRALELADRRVDVPEVEAPPTGRSLREITYEERRGVGYLHFDFYNGAMSTDQCWRLLDALRQARRRPTGVLVLMGGPDFFSNGIHLNVIEAADDPAAESWRNLLAIDEVVREVVETDSQLVVSALTGDAAAGGVPLALAADRVLAREDVVLNPYYRHMGGLYGSEYWTYLLPRRIGPDLTGRLTSAPFEPVGAQRADELGLLDATFGATAEEFGAGVRRYAERLAHDPGTPGRLAEKRRRRALEERLKPLSAYRREELARSHECFFGADPSYHEARHRFVYKR